MKIFLWIFGGVSIIVTSLVIAYIVVMSRIH